MVTTKHKPVLIVIAGPNGSGKTTITSRILRHDWMENAVYVNPDQVAQERFGDWNSPKAVGRWSRCSNCESHIPLLQVHPQLQTLRRSCRLHLCLRQLY